MPLSVVDGWIAVAKHACTRPFSASVYTHVGRGALGCFVLPIDELGWDLPTPEGDGDEANA